MLLVYSTFPDHKSAEAVGKKLIEERLAACVNIIPKIKAFYIWESEICEASEAILLVKIKAENYEKVEKRIKELHPYELPAIFAIRAEKVYSEFLRWIEG